MKSIFSVGIVVELDRPLLPIRIWQMPRSAVMFKRALGTLQMAEV